MRKQMRQRVPAADVSDIDRHAATQLGNVGSVAAVFRYHAVDEQNLRPEPDEAPRDRRADQTQAAGNDHPGPGIGVKRRISALGQCSSLGARSIRSPFWPAAQLIWLRSAVQ